MREGPTRVDERLRLGIEAAGVNQYDVAQELFRAVLREDGNNVPALLWLAFVVPSPPESLHLLRRVLALDPNNKRAQAGVRWAQQRLRLISESSTAALKPASVANTLRPASPAIPYYQPIPEQVPTEWAAPPIRRRVSRLLAILIIFSVLGLVASSVGALLFLPPETLAAWLPTTTVLGVEPARESSLAAPGVDSRVAAAPGLLAAVDTTGVSSSPAVEPGAAPDPVPSSGEITAPELEAVPVAPHLLIGPRVDTPEASQPRPVDSALLAYQPAYPGEKWIEVNITTQQVTAWEGNVPVMSFVASTGLPNTPTIQGKYRIYWKLESTLMVGPNYYLPAVPYTMYFYKGYALHGTYWHSNFGQPVSHGCVNLSTDDSKKLFEWANPAIPPGQTQVVATDNNPGTLVVVHQ